MPEPEGSKSSDNPSPSADVEAKIQEVIEQYMESFEPGQAIDRQVIVDSFPELAPFLERRLRFLEQVLLAARKSSGSSKQEIGQLPGQELPASIEATTSHRGSSAAQNIAHEQATHLRCPHCGNPIQLVQVEITDVTCRVCGSTVHVDPSATMTYTKSKHPAKLGRFEILEVLGRGAFGIVYKARDPELRRTVALKVPPHGYFVTDEEKERFLREARNAARLRHPQIVQVHEVIHEGNIPCIVCDFIDGVTLDDLMSGRRLSFRETAELVAQVGDALDFAHREHVIHRDIKPSNILIDAARRPVITDFGLARRDDGEITITLDGEVLGTPAYMSPEQAEGKFGKVDSRTDVYSLGVVLYRMLAGELPFRGSKRMTLYQVVHDEPRSPRSLNDNVPRDLDTIALKAMGKEPDKRYASARAMAEDLRRWLNGEPIHARPVSRTERLVRWCRRHPVTASLTGTIAMLLILLASVATLWGFRERGVRKVVQIALHSEALQRQRANENAATSRHRLSRQYTTSGIRRMTEGDLFGSLLWFAKAIDLDAADTVADEIHRIRFDAVLRQCPKLTRVWTRSGQIHHIQLSADGQRLLAMTNDNTAVVWDTATGQQLGVEMRHSGPIVSASLSRDGRYVVTASADKTAQIWEAASGRKVSKPLVHDKVISSAAFSSDAKLIVTASVDGVVRIWETENGNPVGDGVQHEGGVLQVVFHPQEERIVTVGGIAVDRQGNARIWNARTGEALAKPMSHDQAIGFAAFSSDGKRLVTASRDATARVWDAETGDPISPPLSHDGSVLFATFSPDGESVVTASDDGTARLWDARSNFRLGRPMRHADNVTRADFSPRGDLIVTSSFDGTARVWRSDTLEIAAPPLPHNHRVTGVAFAPDGRRIFSAGYDGSVKLWDLAVDRWEWSVFHHGGEVTRARFSPDGRRLLTTSLDATAQLWNAATGQKIGGPLTHPGPVVCGDFVANGSRVATVALQHLHVWDSDSGVESLPPLQHGDIVYTMSSHPTAKFVATACKDRLARVWNIQTGDLVTSVRHLDEVWFVAFSPNGEQFVSLSRDKTARVWRTDNGQPITPPLPHSDEVFRAAFSADGRYLATAGWGDKATVWDVTNGQMIGPPRTHRGDVWAVAFSPDQQFLATASHDGSAAIWKWDDGLIMSMDQLESQVNYLDFRPDGKLLATVSGRVTKGSGLGRGTRGETRTWDVSTGDAVTPPLLHRGAAKRVQFSPDGRWLVSSSADGDARLMKLEVESRPVNELQELAELLGGQRTTEGATLEPIPSERLVELFERLRNSYPASFVASPGAITHWNEHFGTKLELKEPPPKSDATGATPSKPAEDSSQ